MPFRSTLLHLRIPFSFFLLPIFLFAVAVSPNLILGRLIWILFILHVLVYPASNGYNSYFDKDTKSIGGLRNPPPVTPALYWVSLLLDVMALVLALYYVSPGFALMILIYGLASKAYSHPRIRLKKMPFTGWLVTGFFQGFFTFLACFMGLNKFEFSSLLQLHILWPATLTSLMLWANYPMTQIYQHEEDSARGDKTLSLLLGVRGTFHFTASIFGVATLGFVFYFMRYYTERQAVVFLLSLLPVLFYFGFWFMRVWKDPSHADFRHTMWLNLVSSSMLTFFFIWLLFDTRNVGRYLFD
ncbi:MAG: UbiA prenyltransferase family protein [Cyclobacteriaceae bacterium]|nr:UbiA prenyltransferase family protein [Cyclobacteriaceae bacterium]